MQPMKEPSQRPDAIRKRNQRMRDRAAKAHEEEQQRQILAVESANEDAARIRKERANDIQYFLSGDALADGFETDSKWLENEIDLYLLDQFGRNPRFDEMYDWLSLTETGRLILVHCDVEPLPLPPPGWRFLLEGKLKLYKPGTSTVVELWERDQQLTVEDMEARAKFTREYTPSLKYEKREGSDDFDWRMAVTLKHNNELRAAVEVKKKAYADKIRVLELQWKMGREASKH